MHDQIDAAAFVAEWWENAEGRRPSGEEGVSTISRKSSGVCSLGVVAKVVTGSMSGQFVLEKCPIRWDLNPPLGDGIRSTCVYITSFFLRNQTISRTFQNLRCMVVSGYTNMCSYSCYT